MGREKNPAGRRNKLSGDGLRLGLKTHQGELKMGHAGQVEFSLPNQTVSPQQTEYIMWAPPAGGTHSTGDQ